MKAKQFLGDLIVRLKSFRDRKPLLVTPLVAVICFVGGWLVPSPWEKTVATLVSNDTVYVDPSLLVDTILTYPDGSVYKGPVVASNGTREGYGKLEFKDGSYCEGEWKDDVISFGRKVNNNSTYIGSLDAKQRIHGYGIIQYSENFVNDKRAQGLSDDRILKSYYGNWDKNMKSGIGRAMMVDGSMVFGHYTNGLLDSVPDKKYLVGEKVYGIDLSHHQTYVDWDNLAVYSDAEGNNCNKKSEYLQPILFAYLKATEGSTYKDGTYSTRNVEAERHGVIKGAYHFYRMNIPVETQVQNFLETVNYYEGDLPPALDVEGDLNEIERYGADVFQNEVLDWLSAVEKKLHVKPIIYTRDNIVANFLKHPKFKGYDFWIARYNEKGPDTSNWLFWQQTERGKINGCDRSVDINVFNGNYQLLLQYIKSKK